MAEYVTEILNSGKSKLEMDGKYYITQSVYGELDKHNAEYTEGKMRKMLDIWAAANGLSNIPHFAAEIYKDNLKVTGIWNVTKQKFDNWKRKGSTLDG